MGPKAGKGATLATRITAETREALDDEARRTGRSLSQVVETWLDRAREGRATYLDRLGGDPAIAAAVEKLALLARDVEMAPVPDALKASALRAAWAAAIPLLDLPQATDPARIQEALALQQAWTACGKVVEALQTTNKEDPVYRRASQPLVSEPKGILGAQRTINEHLIDALSDEDLRHAEAALRELLASGSTARAEIDAALDAVQKLDGIARERTEDLLRAKFIGAALARTLLGPPANA
jgi:hypothetical protein